MFLKQTRAMLLEGMGPAEKKALRVDVVRVKNEALYGSIGKC